MAASTLLGLSAALALAASGCGDGARACTGDLVASPSGKVTWSDGVERVPDRIHVYYSGLSAPRECAFAPPETETAAVSYACWEGPQGPARLRVLVGAKYWDTPFELQTDGCHAEPLDLDVELDPAAGEPVAGD